MTPPAAMPSLAMAVDYGQSRILNALKPLPPGKEQPIEYYSQKLDLATWG